MQQMPIEPELDDAELALHAYLDGELGPEEAAAAEARLLADPEALARFEAYRRQRDLIREAAQVDPSPWTNLKTEALRRELAARLRRVAAADETRAAAAHGWEHFLAPMRSAAVILLVVGSAAGGWVGHSHFAGAGAGLPEYVLEAVGAHQVFATDAIRPAEFSPEASGEALAWISGKLGVALSIPNLDPLGMELVGTRLLGTKEGPLAQFLYEYDTGERLSVTVAPHPESEPVEAFQTAEVAELGRGVVGYWRDDDLDYALVAETDGVELEAVAAQVDRQIFN